MKYCQIETETETHHASVNFPRRDGVRESTCSHPWAGPANMTLQDNTLLTHPARVENIEMYASAILDMWYMHLMTVSR